MANKTGSYFVPKRGQKDVCVNCDRPFREHTKGWCSLADKPKRTKKARRHTLAITITFDRACTKAVALREARNCIHGDFYTTPVADGEPEQFKVASIGRIKANG